MNDRRGTAGPLLHLLAQRAGGLRLFARPVEETFHDDPAPTDT